MTDVLLVESLAQLGRWHAAGHQLQLAVNVSPRTLRDPDFPARVELALSNSGIAPGCLTIEITEHVLATDATRSITAMTRLRRLGCKIAIDDFGTGYSSLAYLKQLPVDELKIDRAFVAALGEDPQDEIIVRATIDLGHQFGLSVTAEGVETQVAMQMLTAMGADAVQGFFLSRPITGDGVSAALANQPYRHAVARPRLQVL
jgi:EAL domain-containing protein (putative c-di-GMP-specific phosphodiesterase class I)